MKDEIAANAQLIHRGVTGTGTPWFWQQGHKPDTQVGNLAQAIKVIQAFPPKTDWALLTELPLDLCSGVCFVLMYEGKHFHLGAIGHGQAELFGAPVKKELRWMMWDTPLGRDVFSYFNSQGLNFNYYK